jgi:hypothetical protein
MKRAKRLKGKRKKDRKENLRITKMAKRRKKKTKREMITTRRRKMKRRMKTMMMNMVEERMSTTRNMMRRKRLKRKKKKINLILQLHNLSLSPRLKWQRKKRRIYNSSSLRLRKKRKSHLFL